MQAWVSLLLWRRPPLRVRLMRTSNRRSSEWTAGDELRKFLEHVGQGMKSFGVTALAVLLLVSACHQSKPPVDLSRVNVGMTKEEAISALGPPDKVAVRGRVEYLQYEAYDDSGWDWQGRRNFRWFFVRLVDGHVDAFGDKGDFDSTKDPTVHVKIDQTTTTTVVDPVNSQPTERRAPDPSSRPVNAPERFDLAAELKRLDQMRKDGLISDSEYADLRKNAIEKAKAK